MGFWDTWVSLTQQEQVELILFMLFFFLISTMPFLATAIKLKKRIKVARIDIYAFLFFYSALLFGAYFIINIWYDPILIYAYLSGPLVGIALLFLVFNNISEGIKRAYVIPINIEEADCEVNLCYVYEYAGYRAIIKLDAEGHEDFGSMWARLIHNKHILLESVGAHFEFTEHKTNIALFCIEWDWYYEERDINGKQQKMRILKVVPLPATEYSFMHFLTKFRDFKKYVRKIADQEQEITSLRSNIYLIAGKKFRKWVQEAEEAYWGEGTGTTDDLIAEFLKEYENLKTPRVLPSSDTEKSESDAEEEESEEEAPEETQETEETEETEAQDDVEEAPE